MNQRWILIARHREFGQSLPMVNFLNRVAERLFRYPREDRKAFDQACEAVGSGDLPGARHLLRSCIAAHPSWPQYHETLGNVLLGLQLPNEAILSFEQALQLDPNRPTSHYGLGVANHMLGRMSQAIAAWAITMDMRNQQAEAAGLPRDIRYLPGELWTAGIGHIALLDFFTKAHRLGLDQKRYIVLADRAANSAYLSLWRDLEVITDPHEMERHRPAAALGSEMPTVVFFKGQWTWIHDAMTEVERLWREGPVLSLTRQQKDIGRAALGLPTDAWFVTLHVRETPNGSIRDADPLTYMPAVDEIVARGGWVVRIGDASMTALPSLTNVVDFAHKPRNEWADVFALSQARLFVGTNSGPAWVAGTFGVPSVLTNWAPAGIRSHYAKVTTINKKLWSDSLGRFLTEAEQRRESYDFVDSIDELRSHAVTAIPNTPAEIRDAVVAALTASPLR